MKINLIKILFWLKMKLTLSAFKDFFKTFLKEVLSNKSVSFVNMKCLTNVIVSKGLGDRSKELAMTLSYTNLYCYRPQG